MKCNKCDFENPAESNFCSKCGTKFTSEHEAYLPTETLLAPSSLLAVGSTFAKRYQILEELGRGGMGRVYKVLDIEINEKIALKILNPDISTDKQTIERFRNELKVARRSVSGQNDTQPEDEWNDRRHQGQNGPIVISKDSRKGG